MGAEAACSPPEIAIWYILELREPGAQDSRITPCTKLSLRKFARLVWPSDTLAEATQYGGIGRTALRVLYVGSGAALGT